MSNTQALDEVKDMHYQYANIVISGNIPSVDMTDEERKFFNLTKAFPANILTTNDTDLQAVRAYISNIAKAVLKSYVNIFGKDSNTAKTISSHPSWKKYTNILQDFVNTIESKSFLQLVLIGHSLLFLLRTSRRALLIYKLNNDAGQTESNTSITNGLLSVFEYLHRYIVSVNNIPLTSSQNSSNSKKLADLEFELATLKNQKLTDRLVSEARAKTRPVVSVAEKLKALFDKYVNTFNTATAEQKTKITRSLEVFLDKMTGTYSLKPSSLEIVSGALYMFKNFFEIQCESSGLDANPEYKNIIAYLINKRGITFMPKCGTVIGKINARNGSIIGVGSVNDTDLKIRLSPYEELYTLLMCILSVLNTSVMDAVIFARRTSNNDIFGKFEPGKPIYNLLLNMYEQMTGSVRVIVKMRDMYAVQSHQFNLLNANADGDIMYGGKHRKRKIRMYIGGMVDKYAIVLNKGLRNVYFSGIDDIYQTFYSSQDTARLPPYNHSEQRLEFGPFYNVLDKEDSNEIVSDTLNYEIMKNTLITNKTNIVFYTYGYSGSGKTYSLFGPMDGQATDGVVWSLISRLNNEGIDVRLVSAKRLYGYLKNSGTVSTFVDNVAESEAITNSDVNPSDFKKRVASWQTIMKNDLSVSYADQFVLPDSFIKPTSNNPSSSRGFYILTFDVYQNGSRVSSIGVVDMAGNEDPYDIMSSMSPTVRPELLDNMMLPDANPLDFDILYMEIYKNMVKFVEFIIKTVYRVKYKGLEIEKLDLTEYSRIEHLGLLVHLGQEFNKLTRSSIVSNSIEASYSSQDSTKKPIRVELKGNVVSLSIDVYPRMLIEFLKLPLHHLASLLSCGSKAYNKLMSMNVKSLYTSSCKRDNPQKIIQEQVQKWNAEPVSLSDIKSSLIIYKNSLASLNEFDKLDMLNSINALLLRYTISQLSTIYKDTMDTQLITTLNMNVQFPDRGIDVKPALVKITKSVQDGFAKCLRDDLSTNGYIIPVNVNDDMVRYKFTTIARIIQEGYYINKANSELIEYFRRKSNFAPVDGLSQTNLNVNFKDVFELSKYDKFQYKLQDDKNNKNANFNTKLVPTLLKSFGAYNSSGLMTQDIMFACIRNDREIGKAIGAIDTLLLVQDLKST